MQKGASATEWMLVRTNALSEVYRKVLDAKQALQAGRYTSVSEAVRAQNLSRSAYYKYKDAVAPYIGSDTPAAYMTVELVLQDCPGVLSGLLSAFARAGANIVTVNQQAPKAGSAAVSVCAKTEGMSLTMDAFAMELTNIAGVQRISSIRKAEK